MKRFVFDLKGNSIKRKVVYDAKSAFVTRKMAETAIVDRFTSKY